MSVRGHVWGSASVEDILLYDPVTRVDVRFDAVLCADLLWDRLSHRALIETLTQVLEKRAWRADEPTAAAAALPTVYVTAGLHTGRDALAHFFRLADAAGFCVRGVGGEPDVHEWAVVGDGAELFAPDGAQQRSGLSGERRRFDPDRPDGPAVERNGWVVQATLTWKEGLAGV